MKIVRWLVAALVFPLAACVTPAERQAPPPELAITIDDLPLHGPLPAGETPLEVAQRMAAALKAAGLPPVRGFTNGRWTEMQPETVQALEAWRSAGLPLGNHTWSHANLNSVTAEQFEEEIVRNEALLERLGRGSDWRWLRFPFLAEGDDPAKRAEVRAFLARRGYRIAAVTMDFGDWQFSAPYARCRDSGDAAGIAELERLYLESARLSIAFYRSLSRSLYARDIPYVLLMHVGALDSRMLPRLLALYREQGFRFVTLEEAERDSVYREDVDPSLPARMQSLEGRARAKGIALPPRADYGERLEAICRPAQAVSR